MLAALRRPRAVLWTAATVVALAFLVMLEVAARHYGMPGPITNQAREVIFAPKSGPLLYAGMALMMVVLPGGSATSRSAPRSASIWCSCW